MDPFAALLDYTEYCILVLFNPDAWEVGEYPLHSFLENLLHSSPENLDLSCPDLTKFGLQGVAYLPVHLNFARPLAEVVGELLVDHPGATCWVLGSEEGGPGGNELIERAEAGAVRVEGIADTAEALSRPVADVGLLLGGWTG